MLPACGDGQDKTQMLLPQSDKPNALNDITHIVHPKEDELVHKKVRQLEYLVAWKNTQDADRWLEQNRLSSASYLDQQNFLSHITSTLSAAATTIEVLTDDIILDIIHPYKSSHHQMPSAFRLLSDMQSDISTARITLIKFASQKEADKTLQQLWDYRKILFAHPNYISSLKQEIPKSVYNTLVDEDFKKKNLQRFSEIYQQVHTHYYISFIQLERAMSYLASFSESKRRSIFERRPIIAILDSGVDVTHPAIRDQLVLFGKKGYQHARACGNDHQGCNVSVKPSSTALGDAHVYPVGTDGFGKDCPATTRKIWGWCNHGTHVAGLAVGYALNIYGVCPMCDFLPIRIVEKDKLDISDASIVRGLNYISLFQAQDGRRVSVVNASFGKSIKSQSVSLLIRALAERDNIVFVAAAGNDNTFVREYPGSLNEVIAVAAVDSKSKKISTSNYGSWVNIAAPGYHIISSISGGDWGIDHGTSMASPMVAGVAGLLQAMSSKQVPAPQIRHIIESSANTKKLYDANPKFQRVKKSFEDGHIKQGTLGFGVLDAYQALKTLEDGSFKRPPKRLTNDLISCGSLAAQPITHTNPFAITILLFIICPFFLLLWKHKNA